MMGATDRLADYQALTADPEYLTPPRGLAGTAYYALVRTLCTCSVERWKGLYGSCMPMAYASRVHASTTPFAQRVITSS